MDDESKELFCAILDEIDLVRKENRILREVIENTRSQVNRLHRDLVVMASEIRFLSLQGIEQEALDNR